MVLSIMVSLFFLVVDDWSVVGQMGILVQHLVVRFRLFVCLSCGSLLAFVGCSH